MSTDTSTQLNFKDFGLAPSVLKVLDDVGYETPSPIQLQTIPLLVAGKDVVGQAQTGTGKTAAFALPILSRIDLAIKKPQVLVLTPTRELAIQVAEAFQRYAAHMKGFHVLPIYGGQEYRTQLRQLSRGVHVVVGTPGRVMDHMRRKTLQWDALRCLVLDEADEMLRMGFVDDVEWILELTPKERQTALFSATMPHAIRRIAQRYLREPEEITIKARTSTAENINQRYWMVSGMHKLDALTRILEAEDFDGMLIFVRTRTATVELSEKLSARGYASAALSGDVAQARRERMVNLLKKGDLDILVATDVAARGLDVERISHVINYDIPYDGEAYIHRVGRTGRAGRSGEAILFVAPREKRMLRVIERATRQKISLMDLPSTDVINNLRIGQFKQRITDTLAQEDLGFFEQLIDQYRQEFNVPSLEIAAALAQLVQGNTPLLLKSDQKPTRRQKDFKTRNDFKNKERGAAPARYERADEKTPARPRPPKIEKKDNYFEAKEKAAVINHDKSPSAPLPARPKPPKIEIEKIDSNSKEKSAPPIRDERPSEKPRAKTQPPKFVSRPKKGMERYRIEVGDDHGVQPGNIVGAIANEAELEGQYIQQIQIYDTYSTVDLPEGMPKEILRLLKKVWVANQQMKMSRVLPVAKKKSSKGKKKKY